MSWLEPLAIACPALTCARPALVWAKLLAVTQGPADGEGLGGGVGLDVAVGGGVGPVPVSPQNWAV